MLHPRRGGIAAHLGLLADRPTIGVSKKLLCGRVDLSAVEVGRPAPVLFREELLGMAVKASATSRPIFISPGNRITVPDAARAVTELFRGHRLPEPIHLVDALSKREARNRGDEFRNQRAAEADYVDIRDDRVMQFFDLRAGATIRFQTRVTATYQGRYYLPGIAVEAMYDATKYARTAGRWTQVVAR